MSTQNIAVKLCGILQSQTDEEITAREWRLIGQEQDGSQIFSWISTGKDKNELLHIGSYTNKTKTLITLNTFEKRLNIIQASVNASHSLLVYVIKMLPKDFPELKEPMYCPYLLPMIEGKDNEPIQIEESSNKQIMAQYVYGKSYKYSPGVRNDRFLLFKHLDSIKIYSTTMVSNDLDDGTEDWSINNVLPEPSFVVKAFSWAQWDCLNQVLYYIYYRQPAQSFAEGEELKSPSEMTPTLSALQFHTDLPHETVLNIPLSLPQLPQSGSAACGEYEDDCVPLRVHDCALDLQIVSDSSGVLCICHHYLYKPLDGSTSSLHLEDSAELKETGVNFAYSVTVLHHGCVVHTVAPELPWTRARALRPSYTFYADNFLLVTIPMLFTHLIDVSLSHEPCCHIVIPTEETDTGPSLAPIVGWGPNTMVDLSTLDVTTMGVSEKDIVSTYKNTAVENKLAIIHYLLLHEDNVDLAEELISWQCLNQRDALGAFTRTLQEYLVAHAHASTRRALPTSTLPLADLLPYTQHLSFSDIKIGDLCVSVTQEKLWNSSVVVLAPRQRVCQFSEDQWTRLWAALNPRPRTRLSQDRARERLETSLTCYQPEALSRCTTPRSPGGGTAPTFAPPRRSSTGGAQDFLPFFEFDVCTASRQEQVTAANLRAVTVHLMQSCESRGGLESGAQAVAARWVAAQVEAARGVCRALCHALHAAPGHTHQRGFGFIDDLDPTHAVLLFKALEQYYAAAEGICFPLPAGFTSFFAYLGFRALPFHVFVQYVTRNVFQIQIDVLKHIISKEDDSTETVNNKLRLIQLVGAGRARRALAAWPHRTSLILRARDHAAALLSGTAARRDHARHRPVRGAGGIAALPNGEKLSSLDTFLDLLTAKASLNELDFNLIIEATLASMQSEGTF